MHRDFPELFPWATFAEIPDENKHNMDEVSETGASKRDRQLVVDKFLVHGFVP
jgi:hypothetical protein